MSQFKRKNRKKRVIFLSTSPANLTTASRTTLDSFLAYLCTQTLAAKLRVMQRWAGEVQGNDLKTTNLQGTRYVSTHNLQHHFSDSGEPEGFFFSLRKPKIASFENMHSVITTSSFCSISGSRLFSCRIIVNMHKIGKTSAWLRSIFCSCFYSVPPETTINLCSNNTKIIIF